MLGLAKPEKVQTFSSFSKEKERERAQFFRPKSKRGGSKSKSVHAKREDFSEYVKVNIGIMANNGSGLQLLRGKGLPVSVRKDCRRDELLKAAADKHKAHSTDIINPLCNNFTLLYPDGTEVEKLKESNDDFVLHKYKSECGKAYHRITFCLCSALDFSKSRLSTVLASSSSENSDSERSDSEIICVKAKKRREDTRKSDDTDLSVIFDTKALKGSDSEIHVQSKQREDTSESDGTDLCNMFDTNTTATSTSVSANPSIQGSYQCPTCFEHFTLNAIENHADECAQAWVDPIGECEVQVQEDDHEGDHWDEKMPPADQPETSTAGLLADIKNAVTNIKCVLLSNVVTNRISVRRSCLFGDYVAARKKRWFKPKGLLKVTFIGEAAVDDGGPKREFFTETLSHIRCKLVDIDGIPHPDMRALANEEFKIAGELFACSIIQGGPAPCCFAGIVYDYIVDGIGSVTTEGWTPVLHDNSLKKSIRQVTGCKSDEELRELLSQDAMLETLQLIGYRGVPCRETLDSVPAITRSMVVTGIAKTLTVIDQLVVGMGCLGGLFVDYIRNHKAIMKPLFTIEGAKQFIPTAELLLDGMTPEYSVDGSNLKAREIDVYKYFNDYVMDLEESGGPQKLYKFITGSDRFTPLGVERLITVRFKYGCATGCKCRPTASTCDPSITLPIHYQDPTSMEQALNSAMDEGAGFGLV